MAGEGGLLDIGYGMDPLSVLGDELRDMPLDPDAVKLVQTEGVQQDLAVVAPWLKNREPFILVRRGGRGGRGGYGRCMQGGRVRCNGVGGQEGCGRYMALIAPFPPSSLLPLPGWPRGVRQVDTA